MRERGIIFSTPMVRAILDGRKSMTRRLILKAQDQVGDWAGAVLPARESGWIAWWPGTEPGLAKLTKQEYKHGFPRPYGVPGDLLYVKETWFCPEYEERREQGTPYYRADGDTACWDGPWKSSRFMPRWAARLWLKITDVRVQRLQEITPNDCLLEGVGEIVGDELRVHVVPDYAARDNYHALWDSLNARRGYPWSSNPWVFAISFERVAKELAKEDER